jgi:NAD(P)-dependent dehydrogenase (short-subunit alcohol dehydrogenase family)
MYAGREELGSPTQELAMTANRSVVVTGASTGIGWGTVKVLVARGFQVFGTVRQQRDADRLKNEFGESFTPLLMDVTDHAAVARAAEQVGASIGQHRLTGLVNNAGIAVPGPLLHLPLEEYRRQLEVNLIAPLAIIQAFAPLLGTDRGRGGTPGRIVNISSVAGKIGIPFLGAYVASKHALEGMSESLRRELLLYGIDVIVIGPGAVATAIWDKAEGDEYGPYRTTDYGAILDRFAEYFITEGRKGLPPEAVGEVAYRALTAAKPNVRYAVVGNKLQDWTLPRLLPKRMVDRLIGRQTGLLTAKS